MLGGKYTVEITILDKINVVCNIIVALCSIIGLRAIILAKREYIHNKSKESAQKAIEMAEYFMNNILTELTIINNISAKNGLNSIIKRVMFYDMVDFDYDEMKRLYGESNIKKINEIINKTYISVPSPSEKEIKIPFDTFVSQTLNKLEYMCMHFSSNLADDDFIYNSLHQIFISSMQSCYCTIAKLNTSNKDKYYTNIITVYNKWADKYYGAQEKEELIREEIEKRRKEATRPSIKTIKK